MTLADLDKRITFYTGTDTNSFLPADRLQGAQQAIDEIETLILRSQDDWEFDDNNQTADPIKSINLVDNTQNYDFLLSDANIVQIKRVDVSYDGIKWQRAVEMAQSEFTNANDPTSIAAYFTKVEPKYSIIASSIYLYPIPDANVTAGLKITVGRLSIPFTSADWTAGTATPGFDRMFHEAIAIKTSFDYCFVRSLNNAQQLGLLWTQKKNEIIDFFSHKTKDKKYALKARVVNYK